MKRQNGQTIDLYFTYGESPMLLITDTEKRNIGFSKKNEIWISLEKKLDAEATICSYFELHFCLCKEIEISHPKSV